MPQTSNAVLAIINKWFPNEEYGADEAARRVLFSKGWTEEAGMFHPPVSSYWGPREDYVLLKYLVEEWDYDYECAPLIPEVK